MYTTCLHCSRSIRREKKIGSNETTVFKLNSKNVPTHRFASNTVKHFDALFIRFSLAFVHFFSSACFLIHLKSLKIYQFWYEMMLACIHCFIRAHHRFVGCEIQTHNTDTKLYTAYACVFACVCVCDRCYFLFSNIINMITFAFFVCVLYMCDCLLAKTVNAYTVSLTFETIYYYEKEVKWNKINHKMFIYIYTEIHKCVTSLTLNSWSGTVWVSVTLDSLSRILFSILIKIGDDDECMKKSAQIVCTTRFISENHSLLKNDPDTKRSIFNKTFEL